MKSGSLCLLFFSRCRTFRLFSKATAQEREYGSLLWFKQLGRTQFALGFRPELKHQVAVHVGVQNFRMHIAFAADRRRVAKPARHFFNGRANLRLT